LSPVSTRERPHLSPPTGPEQARERLLAADVPPEIVAVARRLHEAGHSAVLVGGAVRDFLCGLAHDDWDLATSATPEEVQALFRKTIPTGIQHGTVTVLTGQGERRSPVEVTTFRGEGEYSDGRRPDAVQFLRELEDDLARRDFTINAFAWDPIAKVFTDLFDGIADLNAGLVRAVGVPLERFREDGLRTMRAVRFCASLGFDLHPETEAAITGALDVFDLVSRERVRVELIKLLKAGVPSLGLRPMHRTGLWDRVLAPLPEPELAAAIEAVDALDPDPVVRLARLLFPLRAEPGDIDAVLDGLTPSRAERAKIKALTGWWTDALAAAEDAVAIRKSVVHLRRENVDDALAVLGASDARRAEVARALVGAALSSKELAIKGKDLIAAGIVAPGPKIGDLQDALVEWVIEDPSRNERDALMARARELA
jgi:tRNA nucleotidyltransferase (CCA-adding enzyme)